MSSDTLSIAPLDDNDIAAVGSLESTLLVGHWAGDDDGLAALQAWPGQVEHLSRLHVGEGTKHLLEFRQVGEAGKAAAWP